jgi:hypothetical protein
MSPVHMYTHLSIDITMYLNRVCGQSISNSRAPCSIVYHLILVQVQQYKGQLIKWRCVARSLQTVDRDLTLVGRA